MQRSMTLIRELPYLGKLALLAAAYFGAATLSLPLAIPPGYASAAWPPSGIALAAILVLGYRAWPGIWLGAALANVAVESSFFSAAIIATGNTLEALAAASLMRRYIVDPGRFGRGEDVVKFIVLCALSATIAATVAQAPLFSGHMLSWGEALRNWWTWWQGDLTGMIIVAPLILSWLAGNPVAWPTHKKAEAAFFGSLLILSATAITSGEATHFAPFSLTFVSLPFIIWGAFRFGQREVASAIAVVCAVAVWYVLQRREVFATVPLNELLLMLLTFISMVVSTGLILVAVLRERGRSIDELRSRCAQLESSSKSQAPAPTSARRFEFSPDEISSVPEEEGVYVLFDADEIIYIGRAVGRFLTLRRCLSDHGVGVFGDCTRRASHFAWEAAKSPIARETELLHEFQRTSGRLPRCQEGRRRTAG